MTARLLSFGVWLAVSLTALFWALQVFSSRSPVPATAESPLQTASLGGSLERLLGSERTVVATRAAPAPTDPRYVLLGVVWPRDQQFSAQGIALIAVNEEPALAVRPGASVDDDLVLLSVGERSASLGPQGGPATLELRLPDPSEASYDSVAPVASPSSRVFSPPRARTVVRPSTTAPAPPRLNQTQQGEPSSDDLSDEEEEDDSEE